MEKEKATFYKIATFNYDGKGRGNWGEMGMRNFLKLSIAFAFIWVVLLPQVAFAKIAVVDDGGFFNEGEVQFLEEEFAHSQFHYYIQMVQSLSGQDIGQKAEHLLDSVREQGYDAVILLAAEEREIYVDAMRGSMIDRTIRQHYGSDPYPMLLNETFIPKVVNGDFSDGIYALISEMDSLTYEKFPTQPQREG